VGGAKLDGQQKQSHEGNGKQNVERLQLRALSSRFLRPETTFSFISRIFANFVFAAWEDADRAYMLMLSPQNLHAVCSS
jgi:hypothetical protein